MNQVKSMSDIHEGSHSSSHDDHESVIELLYHLVDKEKFYDTAESILKFKLMTWRILPSVLGL